MALISICIFSQNNTKEPTRFKAFSQELNLSKTQIQKIEPFYKKQNELTKEFRKLSVENKQRMEIKQEIKEISKKIQLFLTKEQKLRYSNILNKKRNTNIHLEKN